MTRSSQIALALLGLCASGCVTRGDVELLESELRQREDQLYAVQMQLAGAESDLTIAQKELQTLRDELAKQGELALLPEQAESLYRVQGIRVNKFFTGGLDRDGEPGDDLLTVVVAPYDKHGETVKLPGDLEVEAIDLTSPGAARSLGVWRYTAAEVAEHWHSGLTTGFQFRMPWHKLPTAPNIVLHARYATVDGRRFGTSEEIRVNPVGTVLVDTESTNSAQHRTAEANGGFPFTPEPNPPVDQAGAESSSPQSDNVFQLNASDPRQQKPNRDQESESPTAPNPEMIFPREANPMMSPESADSVTTEFDPPAPDSAGQIWTVFPGKTKTAAAAKHESTRMEKQPAADPARSDFIDLPIQPAPPADAPERYQRSMRSGQNP